MFLLAQCHGCIFTDFSVRAVSICHHNGVKKKYLCTAYIACFAVCLYDVMQLVNKNSI